MSEEKRTYIAQIVEPLERCNDLPLINMILQLLQKSF